MFAEDHRFVRVVELGVNLLIEIHTVSSDFHRIDSSCSLLPVENAAIEQFISFSSEIDTVASEFVRNACKLAPISGLPLSSCIDIWENSEINVFDWEFE